MKHLVVALVLGSTMSATAQTIPPSYRGEWNENVAHCGTGLNDTRLRIAANSIQFYESGGVIRAAVQRGPFELAIIAELSGEGESWLSLRKFNLSSDGNRLTDSTNSRSGLTRYRCPVKK